MGSHAGAEHWIRGRFVEVAPPTRLVIDMEVTVGAGKPQFRAYTEVDFSDAPGGTRMDVVQSYTFADSSMAWMRFVDGVAGGGRARRMARDARQAGEGGGAHGERQRLKGSWEDGGSAGTGDLYRLRSAVI